MQPIPPPKTLKIYMLLKQTGLNFSTYTSAGNVLQLGPGFFTTQEEAEHNRTLAVLADTGTVKQQFHVFELEVPNPLFQE